MAKKIREYSVIVTQTAEEDLNEIILYLAEDNAQIALKNFKN
ncbi:MAG: type II toxin-antitoxin system RelE/ParE family toxin [Prevotellaceae bacterium]|jgi:plasmid stabilization system protein ParE|nr:type II toxin-antitoxin system RelE/ParE family toxin [Prevotellaceae bacterium]